MGNAKGLDRKYGNGVAVDEKSNVQPTASGQRIGPITGRLKRYSMGHNAGTGGQDKNGMNKNYGNAIASDEGASQMPSRGNKDGG